MSRLCVTGVDTDGPGLGLLPDQALSAYLLGQPFALQRVATDIKLEYKYIIFYYWYNYRDYIYMDDMFC